MTTLATTLGEQGRCLPALSRASESGTKLSPTPASQSHMRSLFPYNTAWSIRSTSHCRGLRRYRGAQLYRLPSPVKLRRQELLLRQDEAASSRPQKVRAPCIRRTRKDPFEGLWCDVLAWLREEPDASAVALLGRLQSDHPDRFSRARLRIPQRQVPMDRHHGKQAGLRRFR